jgi:hypothetical protein
MILTNNGLRSLATSALLSVFGKIYGVPQCHGVICRVVGGLVKLVQCHTTHLLEPQLESCGHALVHGTC